MKKIAIFILLAIVISGCATFHPKQDRTSVDTILQKYVGCEKFVQINPMQGVVFVNYVKLGKSVCMVVRCMATGIPLQVYELVDGKPSVVWENPYWKEHQRLNKERRERLKKNG